MDQQRPPGPLGADAAVTHILVVTDLARSRDFWVGVLGAELFREYGGTSVVLRFAGTWLLLVTGSEDKVGPPDASEEIAAAHGNAVVEIIPDIGHWTALEAAGPVTEHLVKFLQS